LRPTSPPEEAFLADDVLLNKADNIGEKLDDLLDYSRILLISP
jgi:hypothetical protein